MFNSQNLPLTTQYQLFVSHWQLLHLKQQLADERDHFPLSEVSHMEEVESQHGL
jgi:hypothetical protein